MRRLLLPLLLLAACAQPDPADPAAVLQEVLAQHQANVSGVGATPSGPAVTIPGARTDGVEPPVQPRPAASAAAGPTMAGQLVGHGAEMVTLWLGQPRLRREEGTAEIWHYSAPNCHLDLILYRDGEAGPLRVAFASARAVGVTRRSEAACLRDIARGAGGQGSAPLPAERVSAGA